MGIPGALSKGDSVLKPPFMEGDTRPHKEAPTLYRERNRERKMPYPLTNCSSPLLFQHLAQPDHNHVRHGEAGPLS